MLEQDAARAGQQFRQSALQNPRAFLQAAGGLHPVAKLAQTAHPVVAGGQGPGVGPGLPLRQRQPRAHVVKGPCQRLDLGGAAQFHPHPVRAVGELTGGGGEAAKAAGKFPRAVQRREQAGQQRAAAHPEQAPAQPPQLRGGLCLQLRKLRGLFGAVACHLGAGAVQNPLALAQLDQRGGGLLAALAGGDLGHGHLDLPAVNHGADAVQVLAPAAVSPVQCGQFGGQSGAGGIVGFQKRSVPGNHVAAHTGLQIHHMLHHLPDARQAGTGLRRLIRCLHAGVQRRRQQSEGHHQQHPERKLGQQQQSAQGHSAAHFRRVKRAEFLQVSRFRFSARNRPQGSRPAQPRPVPRARR
ncbi:hypothetical protein DEFR109230_01895 [Deinococcus frigens]